MLLTSGQVSIAISSFVVLSFTGALFLSGYVLQQKTVRDIRLAIRPQAVSMQERMYLPPQFDKSHIQVLEEMDKIVVNLKQSSSSDQTDEKTTKGVEARLPYQLNIKQENEDDQGPMVSEEGEQSPSEASSDQSPASNQARPSEEQIEEKPLSRAARRKKIKEQVLADGQGEGFKGYRRRIE